MLESTRLAIRLSELREQINGHNGEDADALAALRAESRELEPVYRAALDAEARAAQADDGAARELAEITRGASLAAILGAVIEGRAVEGREAELQAEHGLAPNQVPLALVEDRQTPAPANPDRTVGTVIQPVFADGDTAYLMIPQRTVPAGDAVFPVLVNRPSVAGPYASTDSTATSPYTNSFASDLLVPQRIQTGYRVRRTDAARFPQMEDSLRMSLNSAISEKLDQRMVVTLGAQLTQPAAPSTAETFATYREKLIYGQIDGRYASVEGDIRLLVGADTLASMASKYRGTTADDSALDSIRRISSGVKVSAFVAAPASNLQDVFIRRGMRDDAVVAIWNAITLIPDEITRAAEGEIQLTAVALAAWQVLRDEGFDSLKVRLA